MRYEESTEAFYYKSYLMDTIVDVPSNELLSLVGYTRKSGYLQWKLDASFYPTWQIVVAIPPLSCLSEINRQVERLSDEEFC